MMGKSWRDDDTKLVKTGISLRELHLLERLRMLEAGIHVVLVTKSEHGRNGLREFDVQESLYKPD